VKLPNMTVIPIMHHPLDVPLALLAGTFTVASPCVLPMLPVVLGSSFAAGARRHSRPLFIVAGFILTFASVGMLLGTASSELHFAQTALHNAALVLLALSGLLRLWPDLYDWLMMQLQRPLITRSIRTPPHNAHETGADIGGNGDGFLLGMSLGAVWTPCAGPVLASILVLVVKAQDPAWSALLLVCYAIGAGIPMLGIIYGGHYATRHVRLVARHAQRLQQVFGALVLFTALAIYLQYDVVIYARIAAFLPGIQGL
jgi:cytochrome c-type biogenesis protein